MLLLLEVNYFEKSSCKVVVKNRYLNRRKTISPGCEYNFKILLVELLIQSCSLTVRRHRFFDKIVRRGIDGSVRFASSLRWGRPCSDTG